MVSPLERCPTCGERISPSVGECLFCQAMAEVPPSDDGRPAPPVAVPPAVEPPARDPRDGAPPPPADPERGHGLLLFEAEECLTRGQAERAMVLASRAVKARPESLTARALYERARRELLQGRRRERLEGRVQEALAMVESGELARAERIVVSALKLVPDHVTALQLFALIRDRRRAAGTVEAEAEREIEHLSSAQAEGALAAARAALVAGFPRRAVTIVRRGLRHVPNHLELLKLLREVERSGGGLDLESARRRAAHGQVRRGLDLLAEGQLDEALSVLRALLREDPDNQRAQAAVQDVRRAWLARAPSPPRPSEPPVPAERPAPAVSTPGFPPGPVPALRRTAPEAVPAGVSRTAALPPAPVIDIPREALLPRRRATPVVLVAAAAAAVVAFLFLVTQRRTPEVPAAAAAPSPVATASQETAPSRPPGPLDAADPRLRTAVESILAAYGRALEARDGEMLAAARPDLSSAERARRLEPFVGALNVAVDLRVIDASVQDRSATVAVLRTDVIVGGRGGSRPPEEEALSFERRDGAWVLADGLGR